MDALKPRGPFQREGAHKRWFWCANKRLGDYWHRTPEREVRKMMRQWSWRRP